jgi:hypothetical protein
MLVFLSRTVVLVKPVEMNEPFDPILAGMVIDFDNPIHSEVTGG